MNIQDIIEAIETKQVRISDHAKDEAKEDSLMLNDIFHSVRNGEIIEDYSNDKPYPSCLIYGKTDRKEPLHSVWAFKGKKKKAVLITVFRPDPMRRVGWKERRLR